MTAIELQALRRLLFFSVPEAADIIGGGVSEQAWRRWESGRRRIPDDVKNEIIRLCKWRAAVIRACHQMKSGECRLYSLDEWVAAGRDQKYWRPHCSAVAEILSREDRIG